ncbi:PIH1 domain-containing protein 1 [Geranomyces variabilis]|uniref:PIH1 domain-containing protein 1 n=1 Tax=Geranomyces variabilis TaxID=109894 RepID=A0AAD5XNN3_9FUNG|nr:PIH1 domain-containing protein 1 [Geranomyces variabilis]
MTIESLLASISSGPTNPHSSSGTNAGAGAADAAAPDDKVAKLLADSDQQLDKLINELHRRVATEGGGGIGPGIGAAGSSGADSLLAAAADAIPSTSLVPEPGFVVKTQNLETVGDWPVGLKVFINVCHSPHVPAPPLATDDEIRAALNAEDHAAYKVPLSLSSPKADRDKSGKTCLVFDACVHTGPLEKAKADFDFKLFLIILALEWVEEKHKLKLSREFTLPKLKAKGRLSKHIIRRAKRPIIAEVAPSSLSLPTAAAKASSKASPPRSLPQPEYDIICEPPAGPPEYIVVRVRLPDLKTMGTATLDVEARRLLLEVPDAYSLDAPLPAVIDTREGGAQFDRATRVLTVTLKC